MGRGGEFGERYGSEWAVYGAIQILMGLRTQEHAYRPPGHLVGEDCEVDAVAVDGN